MITKKQLINRINLLEKELNDYKEAQKTITEILLGEIEKLEGEPKKEFEPIEESRDPYEVVAKQKREENKRAFNKYCDSIAFGARPFSRRKDEE